MDNDELDFGMIVDFDSIYKKIKKDFKFDSDNLKITREIFYFIKDNTEKLEHNSTVFYNFLREKFRPGDD